MRKTPVIFFWVPAVFLAGAVLLIGIVAMPPKFTARTTFAIDWNSMPSVPNDEQADKIRSTWRKDIIHEVINLPSSGDAMAAIVKSVNESSNDPSKSSANISALKGRVQVKLVKHTTDNDQFSIEVQSNDPVFAQAVADGVIQGIISKINDEAEAVSGLAAARSYANVETVLQAKANLEAERRKLNRDYSPPRPPEVRQRLQEIDGELGVLQWDHTVAGIGLGLNVFDWFGVDAVKVIEKTRVENRRGAYGRAILFTAAILGCAAGIVGLGTRRFIQTKSATKRTAQRVPPVINAQPSAPLQPPIINHANP